MIAIALLLAVVEKSASHDRAFDKLTLRDALLIGCAQAFAVIPGVSRSGSTLMAAMALGFTREASARFSFLLSVPVVAAAGVFEMPKVLHAHDLSGSTLAIGLLAAAVAGYASIAWLLRFLRARSTIPFVVYRVALGLLLIGLLATGRL
jgi:undecaprenyl-diphosphatase